jgi:hypothetical protein
MARTIIGKWDVSLSRVSSGEPALLDTGRLEFWGDGSGHLTAGKFQLSLKWSKYLRNDALVDCHGMEGETEISGKGFVCLGGEQMIGTIGFQAGQQYRIAAELQA